MLSSTLDALPAAAANAALSAAGVGLAGVVTGLVLYFLDTDPGNEVSQSLSVEPMLWSGGSGAMTTIRF